MKDWQSSEPLEALKTFHDNRQNDLEWLELISSRWSFQTWNIYHSWCCHRDSRDDDLRDSGSSCEPRFADHLSGLILHINATLQLVLSHQRNVHAISDCDSSKRSVALQERIGSLLQPRFVAEWCHECGRRGWNVGDAQLCGRDWRIGVSIRVIHKRVETLIDKLPEDDCWNGSEMKVWLADRV